MESQKQSLVVSSQLSVPNPQSPTPNPQAEAEACFHKALDIARGQEAKSLELRAAMSLARLWQQQGKISEARELLEETYTWFTEGFDTKDLQDAETLLRALGSTVEKTEGKRQRNGRVGEQESGRREDEKLVAPSPRPFLIPNPSSLAPKPQPPTPSAVKATIGCSPLRGPSVAWTIP